MKQMKDLVDSPALSLGPQEMEEAIKSLLTNAGVQEFSSVVGVENLLQKNFPQIAAVGMAASEGRDPRVVTAYWNPLDSVGSVEELPEIAIIGK